MGEASVTPPSRPLEAAPPRPYPEPQRISECLTLQAPLSRRGTGPGLVLVLDHYASIEGSEKHIDPAPFKKWAEEGYAVAMVSSNFWNYLLKT